MAKRKQKAPEAMAYGEAVEEIEAILESIDRDEVDVDELSEKVERAVSLLGRCREKLRVTDARVQEVLADVEQEAGVVEAETETAEAPPPEEAGPGESGHARSVPGKERPPPRDEDYAEEDDELPF